MGTHGTRNLESKEDRQVESMEDGKVADARVEDLLRILR
jgi:hypothetical protein